MQSISVSRHADDDSNSINTAHFSNLTRVVPCVCIYMSNDEMRGDLLRRPGTSHFFDLPIACDISVVAQFSDLTRVHNWQSGQFYD